MFEHVTAYAGDPIFHLSDLFHQDPRAQKVNLTIGLYYDDEGNIPLLDVVRQAELENIKIPRPRPYLPIEGLADYRYAVQKLLFGAAHPVLEQKQVATIQSLGGTGALKVGGDFLHAAWPDSEIWISDPAWSNHYDIFRGCGIKTHSYPYYNKDTLSLDFDAMLQTFQSLPQRSIILLHPCCHNPTGIDPSREQWQQVIQVALERELIPFLDLAYQGFGDGLDEDAWLVRAMADAGLTFLVANSFSKSFSFYAERCGGLSVVCSSASQAERVLGQLMLVARRIYSTPPAHGAQVIASILNQPELRQAWEADVSQMRTRIATMRQQAFERISAALPAYDARYFIKQRGMFTYTGLSTEQIQALRHQHGVYILDSGRISVPGLNAANIDYFCDAMIAVVNNASATQATVQVA